MTQLNANQQNDEIHRISLHLKKFSDTLNPLPGIAEVKSREQLAYQIYKSSEDYLDWYEQLKAAGKLQSLQNVSNDFDPLKAAYWQLPCLP